MTKYLVCLTGLFFQSDTFANFSLAAQAALNKFPTHLGDTSSLFSIEKILESLNQYHHALLKEAIDKGDDFLISKYFNLLEEISTEFLNDKNHGKELQNFLKNLHINKNQFKEFEHTISIQKTSEHFLNSNTKKVQDTINLIQSKAPKIDKLAHQNNMKPVLEELMQKKNPPKEISPEENHSVDNQVPDELVQDPEAEARAARWNNRNNQISKKKIPTKFSKS